MSDALNPVAAHHRFWPRGVARSLCVPRVTLPHFLDTAATRFPDKTAIRFVGTDLSYAQLRARVDALAAWMQRRWALAQGERVLLVSQNCPQFVTAFLAVLRCGAVVVPVNPMSTADEICHVANDSGSTRAVIAQELTDLLQHCVACDDADPARPLRAVLVHAYSDAIDATSPEAMDAEATPAVVAAPQRALPASPEWTGLEQAVAQATLQQWEPLHVATSPDDLCVLPYTSGTTGRPKGCRHSHATVLSSNWASQLWRSLNADAVMLAVAPLFHMLGMQNGMNLPLVLGGTVVMMPRWHAPTALRLIASQRITIWTAPPAMVIDAFSHPLAQTLDLSSLSLLSGGGAAMPEAIAALLAERFGLHYNEAYGLTETAAFLHANPVHRGKRQCLGVPTQGVTSHIVDPQTLEELPDGEVGELVTSGPQVMLGYWRNPQADAESFFERDGRRFFRTGDLAWRDADGYYFMRDRLKRMVNVSGYKVWPAEVESLLYRHPAIAEACVIGLPDARQGERVKAVVVLKPEAQASVDTTPQALLAWARTQMAVYKAPREFEIVAALPRSGTGKIDWRRLQNEHAQREQALMKENER